MMNGDKYSKCPIRHVLSLFSDKWSLLVLCNLHVRGNMRFGELASAMTDISERMLTVRLKNLERHNNFQIFLLYLICVRNTHKYNVSWK